MNFNFQDSRAEVRAGIIIKVFENDPSHVNVKLQGPMRPLEIVSAAIALIKYAIQMDQEQGISARRIKQTISSHLRSIKVHEQTLEENSDHISQTHPQSLRFNNGSTGQMSPKYPKSQLRKNPLRATHFITLTHRNID